MKSIWNGAISFGLVNIPVSLYSAETGNDLKFSLIDCRDDNKIKYQRINEVTGEEVGWENIAKAYRFENGNYVVMTDDDFVKADVTANKTLDIQTFIKREELDLKYLDKPYYILPDKGGEKAYVLLREALNKQGRIAVARVVLRTKGYLAAIYSQEQALVLNLIRFYDEIRVAVDLKLPADEKISAKELLLAESLIESMTEEWKPEDFRDEYRDAVLKRIEAKAQKTLVETEDEKVSDDIVHSGKIIDIMDLLKKSVEAKKSKPEQEVKKTDGKRSRSV